MLGVVLLLPPAPEIPPCFLIVYDRQHVPDPKISNSYPRRVLFFNRLETRDKDWAKLKLWGRHVTRREHRGWYHLGGEDSLVVAANTLPKTANPPADWTGSSILFKSSYHGWSSVFELYLVVIVPPCLSEEAILFVCHPIGSRFWATT